MTPQDKELMKGIIIKHATTIAVNGKVPDKKQVEEALSEPFFEFVFQSMDEWGNLKKGEL